MTASPSTFWSPTPISDPLLGVEDPGLAAVTAPSPALRPPASRRAGDLLDAGARISALPGLAGATKQRYATWSLRYLRFLLRRNVGDPRPKYLSAFLRHLSADQGVPAPQRREAAEALTFFHEVVLGDVVKRTPADVDLLTGDEQRRIVEGVYGTERLLAVFVFATGLSLDEALRLRVGDVDLDGRTLVVRDDSGRALDRMPLPEALAVPLTNHLAWVRSLHGGEVSDGTIAAPVPSFVATDFPGAERSFAWQFLFPNPIPTPSDDATGRPVRDVMDASRLRAALDAYAGTKTRVLRVDA